MLIMHEQALIDAITSGGGERLYRINFIVMSRITDNAKQFTDESWCPVEKQPKTCPKNTLGQTRR
jgi:hypothetical protein